MEFRFRHRRKLTISKLSYSKYSFPSESFNSLSSDKIVMLILRFIELLISFFNIGLLAPYPITLRKRCFSIPFFESSFLAAKALKVDNWTLVFCSPQKAWRQYDLQ